MEKIKKLFAYMFTVEFLLKILIITAIITLFKGEFTVWHRGNLDIGTSYGGLELKLNSSHPGYKSHVSGFVAHARFPFKPCCGVLIETSHPTGEIHRTLYDEPDHERKEH